MGKLSRDYRMSKERVSEYIAEKFIQKLKCSNVNSPPYGFEIKDNKIKPLFLLKTSNNNKLNQ